MYDLIIIGSGPAGLTAGIYARMANKNVLILEKSWIGGQVANIFKIKNYPGFNEIDGYELSQNMYAQAKQLGVEFKTEEVTFCDLKNQIKIVNTHQNTYKANAVIVATGAFAKNLEVKNEKQFYGKGVSYCATCDGNFFKDKIVAVVGGGNTSIDNCLYLTNLAKQVYLIHRREDFTANQTSLKKINALSQESSKLVILSNTVITELDGDEKLKEIKLLNKKTNKESSLKVEGLFVAIGKTPDTQIFKDQLILTDDGYIKTDKNMQTNIKNVYAIGDVRDTNLRQIVTACADGAIAVSHYLSN